MKTIEVSESALESLKAMAQKLQEERDMLLEALKPFAAFAKHYPLEKTYGNRPYSGIFYGVETNGIGESNILVEDFHAANDAIAACQESTKVLES